MKSFINKYAEKVGSAGTLIPLIYWFSVWFDFSKINILFIFLLPLSAFFWVWTISEEFKIRKKYPNEKKAFFLIMPFTFLIFSTISTIHIYYQ
tara:strand:- start:9 stop:287 length:279 start_codon:yes stop_codon:yes gene_type:complete